MKRNYLLTLLCLLVATSVNAELRTETVERFNGKKTFSGSTLNAVSNGVCSLTDNHVTFKIDNVKQYNSNRLEYDGINKAQTKVSNFSWEIESGYKVELTGISCQVRGYCTSGGSAYAQFNGGNRSDNCQTTSLGTSGSKSVFVTSDAPLSSPKSLTLTAANKLANTTFTIHDIAFTYKVTQDVPVFQYKSIADGSEGGNVYSSLVSFGAATTAEAISEAYDANIINTSKGLVQTAYFKAVPATGYVFVGWKENADDAGYVSTSAEYSEELTSYSNDDDAPATITRYAVFSAKNTPLFSGSNQTLNVSANQVTDFAFQYTSSSVPSADTNADFYYSIKQTPDATTKEGSADATQVVAYDPATNTLTGLNSGTAVITFTQKESTNYYAASQSYEITVNKNTGTLTNNLGAIYYIDDAPNVVDCYTASNDEVEVQVESSNTDVIAVIDGQLKAVGAGTATVTFKQAETYKWTALSASQEITVTKYDVSAHISQAAATWDATISNPFAISYNLNDYTVEALDPAIATYTDGAIQTYAETGTASFVLSRPEDYKYNQLAETLSISVAPKTDICYVLEQIGEVDINTYSGAIKYDLSDIGETLSVLVRRQSGGTQGFTIKGYDANGNATTLLTLSNSDIPTSYGSPFTASVPASIVRIEVTSGGTLNKYFKELRITRANYLTPSAAEVSMSSTISTDAQATVDIAFGSCGATLKVVSNNPKITVSPTSFYAEGNGTQEITLIGDATVLGTETATITIYDQSKKTTVNVTSTITRIPQTITWNSSFENLDVFSTVALDATASGATTVTYSIAEEDQAKAAILENVLSFNEVGTVHVVATAAQSDIYETASDTVSVVVSLAQPMVSVLPTVEPIAYGTALTYALLQGGVAMYDESGVDGSFAWADGQITENLTPNTYFFNVRFTPADATHYSTADCTVEVTVTKANPVVSQWPTATLTYGETLADVVLTGKSDNEGTFQWGDSLTEEDRAAVKTAETYTHEVKFVPVNSELYNTVYGLATITIQEATQEIIWENYPTLCNIGDQITLEAKASSGLPVEYFIEQNGNYATIDPETNILTALAQGSITLEVSQQGEVGKYLAANVKYITISILPKQPTNTESLNADMSPVSKVIRNGQLYILRGDKVYDASGRLVVAE